MKYLQKPVDWIIATLLIVMIGLANWAVVQRYIIGQPLHFGEEVSGFLLLWIVMIGAIAAERDRQHLAISFIVDALPMRGRLVITVLGGLFSVAVLGFTAWIGWQLANSVGARRTDILGISFFWIYLAMPVGFIGIALYMLADVIRSIRRGRVDD